MWMIFSDMCMYTIISMKMAWLQLKIKHLPVAMAGQMPDFLSLFAKLYFMMS